MKITKGMLGKRFGRLLVLRMNGTLLHRSVAWVCKCDCGKETIAIGSSLRTGDKKSCGCLLEEKIHQGMGRTHGMTRSPTYRSWESMWGRCTRPNDPVYDKYGGRGISVCERWSKFEEFLSDMGTRPEGLSLDRIDNSGNYEPGNCRWATPKQQSNNTRWNRTIKYNGRTYTARELSDLLGLSYNKLRRRIFREGWSISRAISIENGRSKLTEQDILDIRKDRRKPKDIAAAFSMSPQQINRIRRGDSWGELL
jgi:hypothetical protein